MSCRLTDPSHVNADADDDDALILGRKRKCMRSRSLGRRKKRSKDNKDNVDMIERHTFHSITDHVRRRRRKSSKQFVFSAGRVKLVRIGPKLSFNLRTHTSFSSSPFDPLYIFLSLSIYLSFPLSLSLSLSLSHTHARWEPLLAAAVSKMREAR
jgi:hypothetical protein